MNKILILLIMVFGSVNASFADNIVGKLIKDDGIDDIAKKIQKATVNEMIFQWEAIKKSSLDYLVKDIEDDEIAIEPPKDITFDDSLSFGGRYKTAFINNNTDFIIFPDSKLTFSITIKPLEKEVIQKYPLGKLNVTIKVKDDATEVKYHSDPDSIAEDYEQKISLLKYIKDISEEDSLTTLIAEIPKKATNIPKNTVEKTAFDQLLQKKMNHYRAIHDNIKLKSILPEERSVAVITLQNSIKESLEKDTDVQRAWLIYQKSLIPSVEDTANDCLIRELKKQRSIVIHELLHSLTCMYILEEAEKEGITTVLSAIFEVEKGYYADQTSYCNAQHDTYIDFYDNVNSRVTIAKPTFYEIKSLQENKKLSEEETLLRIFYLINTYLNNNDKAIRNSVRFHLKNYLSLVDKTSASERKILAEKLIKNKLLFKFSDVAIAKQKGIAYKVQDKIHYIIKSNNGACGFFAAAFEDAKISGFKLKVPVTGLDAQGKLLDPVTSNVTLDEDFCIAEQKCVIKSNEQSANITNIK